MKFKDEENMPDDIPDEFFIEDFQGVSPDLVLAPDGTTARDIQEALKILYDIHGITGPFTWKQICDQIILINLENLIKDGLVRSFINKKGERCYELTDDGRKVSSNVLKLLPPNV